MRETRDCPILLVEQFFFFFESYTSFKLATHFLLGQLAAK